MATGRILQFDQTRGYGFVAADDGGEDVFLHASVFDGDSSELAPGMRVEFQVMAGDRGRKAFAAHPTAEPAEADQPVPAPPLLASQPIAEPEEEQMCDVLSPAEFTQELTELLINAESQLTAAHIVTIRRDLLDFAKKHGWVDG